MSVSRETLLAYSLGQVTGKDAREVERFLLEQPEEAARVRDYLDCLMALTMRLEPEVLPADAEAALLKRLHVQGAAEALLGDEEELEPILPEPAVLERAEPTRPAERLERVSVERPEEEVTIDPNEPPSLPSHPKRSPAWLFVLLALAALAAALWYALPLLRTT